MAKVASLTLEDCQCNPDTIQSEITIVEASYDKNCMNGANLYRADLTNNLKPQISAVCDGISNCSFVLDPAVIGDPQPVCKKELIIEYTCSGGYHPVCEYNITKPPPEAASRDVSFGDGERYTNCRQLHVDAQGMTLNLQCPQEAARRDCLKKRAGCGRCALDSV